MSNPVVQTNGKLRIGIDAKWFYTGPVSTRTVLQNLLPALFDQYPEHDWIIFLDKKDKRPGFPYQKNNIFPCYVWADNNLLSNVFILPSKAKKLKVDILVYQTFPSFNRTLPSIAFIHDVLFKSHPQFFSWKEKLYFKPLLWLAPAAGRLITTTHFVTRELIKYGYRTNAETIDLVPLAVSSGFCPRELHNPDRLSSTRYKFQLPDHFILYVGRLNTRKNIESILVALPQLNDQNIPLVVVGDKDWKAPDLEKLIIKNNVGNRIIFTGGVSNDELTAIYALSTIFCFPSYAEGFGLPPLEAMASGVPVIVSNTTALPEVCGTAALYINPDDPSTIASAINLLLTDSATYAVMKKTGIEHAATYSWEKTARMFMDSIYKTTKK